MLFSRKAKYFGIVESATVVGLEEFCDILEDKKI